MHKRYQALRIRLYELQKYATLNNMVLGIAVVIALGWVWGGVDALGRNYRYQQQVDSERANNELISLQNDNLKAEQSYLQSNEYLELAARANLNKALPGEKLLILPDQSESVKTPTTSSSPLAPLESNYAQWLDFLLGKHTES